ncbi:MAG: hypothetical protein ACK6AT_10320, partial [Planctomycetota bacterium]
PGTKQDLGSTLDLMATFTSIANGELPENRKLDSYDLSGVLFDGQESPRDTMFYWTNAQLHAVRKGPWKLHLKMREAVNYGKEVELPKPELYNIERDISEKYNLADKLPETVENMLKLVDEHLLDIDHHEVMLAIPLHKCGSSSNCSSRLCALRDSVFQKDFFRNLYPRLLPTIFD